jgi:O-acetyl-ADP-ribose deacetylase (regulator of RNase III)
MARWQAPDGRYSSHWSARAGEPILQETFAAALAQAGALGATSVAMPSIGCGVHCWPARLAAKAAFDALQAWAAQTGTASGPKRVDIVLKDSASAELWSACARERFGPLTMRSEEDRTSVDCYSIG